MMQKMAILLVESMLIDKKDINATNEVAKTMAAEVVPLPKRSKGWSLSSLL